jgi:hypothetical protein
MRASGPEAHLPAFPAPPPDSLKRRTLERLDELSANLDAQPAQPDVGVAEPGRQVRVASEVASLLAPAPHGDPGERAILDIPPAREPERVDIHLKALRERLENADARVKKLESERRRLYFALAIALLGLVFVAILVGQRP